jgi:hypothetical protein
MATQLHRRDDWLVDSLGNALSGVGVYVCAQPANTNVIPPSPLVQLYSDSAGANPITQPVQTNGQGHAEFYVAAGTYTLVFYSPQIEQVTLPDQIVSTTTVSFGNDTFVRDGVTAAFTLSSTPFPPQSLIVTINGIFQTAYAFSSDLIVFSTPPPAGSVINAIYQAPNQ